MKRGNFFKITSAILVLLLGILSCRSQPIPLSSPTPVSTLADSNPESSYEIYAGFTDNSRVPFIMLHESGERLGVITSRSGNIEGITWRSINGEAVTVYADMNFVPQKVIIGDDILLYSNYDGQTFDITILRADGTSETFKVKTDTKILDMLMSFGSSVTTISYSDKVFNQVDKWFFIKSGLYILTAAVCISEITGSMTIVGLPNLLQGACGGFILETIIRAGNLLKLDVGDLESAQAILDTEECLNALSPDILSRTLACANILANTLEQQEKASQNKIEIMFPPCTTQPDYICGRLVEEKGVYNDSASTFLYLACYAKGDSEITRFSIHPLGIFVRSLDNQVVFLDNFVGKNLLLWYPNPEVASYGVSEVDKYEVVNACP